MGDEKNGETGILRRLTPLTRKEKMAKGEKEAAEKRAKNRAERRGNAVKPGNSLVEEQYVGGDEENEERAKSRAERRGNAYGGGSGDWRARKGTPKKETLGRRALANRAERRGNAVHDTEAVHKTNEKRARAKNREQKRGNAVHRMGRGSHEDYGLNEARALRNKEAAAKDVLRGALDVKEDDPGDAVWSKIEKRKAKRAAAKERRRTGRLNKNQRRDEKNRKEKTLNLKDMRIPIDNIMQNDAGDMVVAIPEEYHTEEVLTQMKEHFASKHPNGTVEETRDEEGNVTGLHWAKDEGEEPETLLTLLDEEVTVEVQAATEEEAVAKIQERLQELTGDPELAFDSPVNRREAEPEEIPPEIAKLEENLEPRRKSRVVERGYERNHKLVGLTKRRAGYRCEVKGCTVELFVKPDGHRYVEVHHLIMMAEGGPDTLENMVCLCPNHHRELHYGENKKRLKRQLQTLRAGESNGRNNSRAE
jgi:hypothetical protein